VPPALFAGTVTTSRAALSLEIPLVIALSVAIIGLYGVVFLFSRIVFRMQVSGSALAALTASAPAVPFVGPGVLGELFGGLSAIPIAIASLVINLTVVPVTILLLALDSKARDPQENTPIAQEGKIYQRDTAFAPYVRQTVGISFFSAFTKTEKFVPRNSAFYAVNSMWLEFASSLMGGRFIHDVVRKRQPEDAAHAAGRE
jgi:predicted permease